MAGRMLVSWESTRNGVNRRPTVFVSSSVYDKEDMLRQIYDLLATNGYEPWMSFKGSIAVPSFRSAFDNCLHSVADADFFIGIISPWYGSGVDKDDPDSISITHQEMRRARELKLPRLLLVDDRVVVVRQFLDSLGFKHKEGRARFRTLLASENGDAKAFLKAQHSCDLRSIDLYDEMTLGEPNDPNVKPADRIGNWVQSFKDVNDVKAFLAAQFSCLKWPVPYVGNAEAVARIEENFRVISIGGKKGAGR